MVVIKRVGFPNNIDLVSGYTSPTSLGETGTDSRFYTVWGGSVISAYDPYMY